MKKSEPQSQFRKRRTQLRSEALEVRRLLAADLQITPIGEMVEVEVELATDQLQGHYHADGTYHLHPHDHESADDHDDNCSCCICSQTHSHGEYELRYNSEGLAYWFDPAPVLDPQEARADNRGEDDGVFAASSEVKVGLDQIPVLNSNPGAPHVFYLDFDGQVVSGTSWNKDNDNNAIHSLPYDLDGDPTTFVPSELDAIREIWSRVAEDYAPFEINITTEEPDAADLRTDRKALRGIITTNRDDMSLGGTGNEWSKNAGGIAFINSWTWPREEPVWAFYNQLPQTPKAVAEAIAHEFGHALGLQHDGTTASPYYRGHGDGETSWAPIMGAGYDANVTQWSRGDYDDANNRQDDISIITNLNNRITFREDDHVYGNDESTPLEIENGRIFGSGVIETATDRDTFNFTHDGGPVLLKVEPFAIGPNLDIAIELFSEESAFDPILELAPTDSLSVEISMELDAGTYFLDVDGGGHQPEEGQGFSQYGSVGQYTISGYLGTPELTANAGGPYVINEGESLVLNGSDSLAPGNAVSYGWDLDADGQFDDALGVIAELTWQQLSQLDVPINDQGSFNVALEVRDSNNISTDLTSLVVQNVAPVVEIREPESAFAGSSVQLDADATDIALDSLAYEWNLGDGTVLANDGASIQHTFEEPGTYTIMVTVSDDDGAAKTAELVLDVVADIPPIVVSSSIVEGRIDYDLSEVTFWFSQDVSSNLNEGSLVIVDTLTDQVVTPSTSTVTWHDDLLAAEFAFEGIEPGQYRFQLSGLANEYGSELDGDADGVAGGDWVVNTVLTYAGDANRDLRVDFLDFLIVAQNFGSTTSTWDTGDFNRDGTVDFNDFLIVAMNFGLTEQALGRG